MGSESPIRKKETVVRATLKSAKSKRGQQKGDGKKSVINCRKLSQNLSLIVVIDGPAIRNADRGDFCESIRTNQFAEKPSIFS